MEDKGLTFGRAEARLWIIWLGASLGAVLLTDVLRSLVFPFTKGELATVLGFVISWLFGGLILAAMQWLVLRRWIPSILGWLIATMAGVFLFTLLGLATNVATAAPNAPILTTKVVWAGLPDPWSGVAGGALFGAAIGVAQWIVWRRRFCGAGWWIVACTVGSAFGGLLEQGPAWLGILALLAPGAVTGIALVWLARQAVGEGLRRCPVPRSRPAPIAESGFPPRPLYAATAKGGWWRDHGRLMLGGHVFPGSTCGP